jgi:hypothetical protein
MNHDRAKPGLPSRFRTTTVQAIKQTVEAETGWLSQRFAPSEKPKPSPRGHRSALLNLLSSPVAANPPWAVHITQK